MKHRVEKRKENEWRKEVSSCVYLMDFHKRWRAIRKIKRERAKRFNRLIKKMMNKKYSHSTGIH